MGGHLTMVARPIFTDLDFFLFFFTKHILKEFSLLVNVGKGAKQNKTKNRKTIYVEAHLESSFCHSLFN